MVYNLTQGYSLPEKTRRLVATASQRVDKRNEMPSIIYLNQVSIGVLSERRLRAPIIPTTYSILACNPLFIRNTGRFYYVKRK